MLKNDIKAFFESKRALNDGFGREEDSRQTNSHTPARKSLVGRLLQNNR
jgi:hypothetical protein